MATQPPARSAQPPPASCAQYLAAQLRLPPDVAGVTLFALASGAPDLFTSIAAVAAGHRVDLALAVRQDARR